MRGNHAANSNTTGTHEGWQRETASIAARPDVSKRSRDGHEAASHWLSDGRSAEYEKLFADWPKLRGLLRFELVTAPVRSNFVSANRSGQSPQKTARTAQKIMRSSDKDRIGQCPYDLCPKMTFENLAVFGLSANRFVAVFVRKDRKIVRGCPALRVGGGGGGVLLHFSF